MIPHTVLIAVEPFGEGLGAERAGAAIGRGLQAGDPSLRVDLCPIEPAVPDDFDTRMRAARAVVVGCKAP